MSASAPSLETGLVALALSTVVRLQLAFLSAPDDKRRLFLVAAADALDTTIADKHLQPQLRRAGPNPVPTLVAQRSHIAAVPPGLWHAARVSPLELGEPHASALMSVDLALRRTLGQDAKAHSALLAWLEDAWLGYPELKPEVLALLALQPKA